MINILRGIIQRLNYQPFLFLLSLLIIYGIISPSSLQTLSFYAITFIVAVFAIYAFVLNYNRRDKLVFAKSEEETKMNKDTEMEERLCYFEWVRKLPQIAWGSLLINILGDDAINVEANNRAECVRYIKNRGQLTELKNYLQANFEGEKPNCMDQIT